MDLSPSLQPVLETASLALTQSLTILDLLSTNPTDQTSHLLSTHQKLLTTHLAHLRRLNRSAIHSVRTTKAETAHARQEIDALHLQLQNLYYEQRHLRGEIAGCEDYDHIHLSLPLTPPEDFLSQHPEHASSSEHDLTVARIQDEHAARQALEEQRLALLKRKEALVKETSTKREELAKLDGEMEKWIAGEAVVRKIFDAKENKTEAEEGKAR